MRRIKTTMAAACVTLAMTAGMAAAQTTPPDRKTFVTFSGPVSIPGMTLPAGTYTFRIMDSNTDRHVVQIFNQDGTKLMTTLLAVSAQRLEPTGDPVITFKETASNRAPAVHYWYYAGDLAGNEFVYPKDQAQMIANASGEEVMAVDSTGKSIDDWKSGSMSRVKPNTTSTAASDTTTAQQPTAAASTTQSSTTAQPMTTQPTTTADQPAQPTTVPSTTTTQPTTSAADTRPTTAPSTTMDHSTQPMTAAPTTAPSTPETVGTSGRTKRLPKTASELPMVGLIGLLALGGAVALRVARTV